MSIIVTSRLKQAHNTRSIAMLKKYFEIKHTTNVVCTEKYIGVSTFQNVNKILKKSIINKTLNKKITRLLKRPRPTIVKMLFTVIFCC